MKNFLLYFCSVIFLTSCSPPNAPQVYKSGDLRGDIIQESSQYLQFLRSFDLILLDPSAKGSSQSFFGITSQEGFLGIKGNVVFQPCERCSYHWRDASPVDMWGGLLTFKSNTSYFFSKVLKVNLNNFKLPNPIQNISFDQTSDIVSLTYLNSNKVQCYLNETVFDSQKPPITPCIVKDKFGNVRKNYRTILFKEQISKIELEIN